MKCFVFQASKKMAIEVHGVDQILESAGQRQVFNAGDLVRAPEIASVGAFFTLTANPYAVGCSKIIGVRDVVVAQRLESMPEHGFQDLYRGYVEVGGQGSEEPQEPALLLDHEVLIGVIEAKFNGGKGV